jgi:glycosyltransferase involved in cell wall biosynthesis
VAEGILLRNADAVFAVSEIDAHNFNLIYGVKPQILPNCVDTEVFNNIEERRIRDLRLKYRLEGKIILFMGMPFFKPNKEAIALRYRFYSFGDAMLII